MLILHRRKLITGAAAMAAMAVLPREAHATTTALSLTDHDGGVTIGGTGNLTMTYSSGTDVGGRADTSYSAGLVYCEATGHSGGLGNITVGLSNAAAAFSTLASAGTNGIVVKASGAVIKNGVTLGGSTDHRNATTTVGMYSNFCTMLFWVNNDTDPTTFNAGGTANPTTGIGGYSLAGLGPALFPFATIPGAGQGPWTFNFGATTFAMTVSSGYSSWDTGGGACAGTGRSRIIQ